MYFAGRDVRRLCSRMPISTNGWAFCGIQARLCFFSALEKRIAGVWGSVASLAGVIANRMIPLALGIELFESKVEGSMRVCASGDGFKSFLKVPGRGSTNVTRRGPEL